MAEEQNRNRLRRHIARALLPTAALMLGSSTALAASSIIHKRSGAEAIGGTGINAIGGTGIDAIGGTGRAKGGVSGGASANAIGGTGINAIGGTGINAIGGTGINAIGGTGINAIGGTGINAIGGTGIDAIGGTGIDAIGGTGIDAIGGTGRAKGGVSGGASANAIGGTGINAIGGTGINAIGGTGIDAIGGTGINAIGGTGIDAIGGTGRSQLVLLGPVEAVDASLGTVTILGRKFQLPRTEAATRLLHAHAAGAQQQVAVIGRMLKSGAVAGLRIQPVQVPYVAGVSEIVLTGRVDFVDSATNKAVVNGIAVDYVSLFETRARTIRAGSFVTVRGTMPQAGEAINASVLILHGS